MGNMSDDEEFGVYQDKRRLLPPQEHQVQVTILDMMQQPSSLGQNVVRQHHILIL